MMKPSLDSHGPTLEDAVILAVEAHKSGPPGKAGQPYIFHILRVMMKLNSEAERMAGVLHELGHTLYPLAELKRRGYPEQVVEALDCLTKRNDESNDQFIERVKANPIARRVRIADLEDAMTPQQLLVLDMEALDRVKKHQQFWQGVNPG